MTQGPDPRAAVRGFMALVLDMVRIDPDRRPSGEMLRWHRDLAASIGVLPEHPSTNRELLDGALRLSQVLNGPGRADSDAPAVAEAAALRVGD
jgi:hypothetical protein